jgi:hypothetical protein
VALQDELVDDDVEHRAGGEAQAEWQQRLGVLEDGERRDRGRRLDDPGRRGDEHGQPAVVSGSGAAAAKPSGTFWTRSRARSGRRDPLRRRRRRPRPPSPRGRCESSERSRAATPGGASGRACDPARQSERARAEPPDRGHRARRSPARTRASTSQMSPRSSAGTSRLNAVAASITPAVKPSGPSRRRVIHRRHGCVLPGVAVEARHASAHVRSHRGRPGEIDLRASARQGTFDSVRASRTALINEHEVATLIHRGEGRQHPDGVRDRGAAGAASDVHEWVWLRAAVPGSDDCEAKRDRSAVRERSVLRNRERAAARRYSSGERAWHEWK